MTAMPLLYDRPGRGAAIVGLGVLALVSMPWSAQAACMSPGFNPSGIFCNNCRYEGTMVVGRDQACERTYQPPPNLRETIAFFSNRVVKRAQHGIAGANGNTFAYMPSKGYVGRDEFVVEVAYRQGQTTGKFSVHWSITVQ
jgi:hypothetical protein